MKRTLIPILILALSSLASAQQSNPQANWPATMTAAAPIVWLPLNDATAVFKDVVSGLNFSGSAYTSTVTGVLPATLGGAFSTGLFIVPQPHAGSSFPVLTAGNVTQITVTYPTAPTVGQTIEYVIGTTTGTNITPTSITTLTIGSTATTQTFNAPTDFTAIPVTAGEIVGFYVASGSNIGYGAGVGGAYIMHGATAPVVGTQSNFSGGYGATQFPALQTTIEATFTSPSPTPQQAGFDATTPNNYSAAFPYNAWNAAPNATLGAIDWNVPWSMMLHVDRLNWNRSGTLVLASKGDIASTSNSWLELYLTMNGSHSQLCFARNGSGAAIGSGGGTIGNKICTSATFDAMPNGLNYDLVVTDNGTGGSGNNGANPTALSLYINGLAVSGSADPSGVLPGGASSSTYDNGFGAYQITVTGGGTGYAASTAFTATCPGIAPSITGTITASGGVMTTGTSGVAYLSNYGCTSAPTIVLTAPTGSGATFSYQANGASMNSTTYPMLAPGYVSGGALYGIDASDSTQTSTYIDEFAIFPNALTPTQIAALYYQAKFYQTPFPIPTLLPLVVLSEDGCGDTDNIIAFNAMIGAHLAHRIRLLGVEDSTTDGVSQAFYRQSLDQAGLNDVPVSVPSGSVGGSNLCTTGDITASNASTPQATGAYESSSTMYRTIFAAHPSQAIYIANGGPLDGIAQFLASGADSISSMTGEQLWAQDAANGGAFFLQGLGCCSTYNPLYYTYPAAMNVIANGNNGAMPVYAMGGTPAQGGPGALVSRTSKDPLWLLDNTIGTDVRSCWDCLSTFGAIYGGLSADPFAGSVTVAYSGGTGYANSTPFTLSGGGANCQGSGIMTASGGVPNGITQTWGGAVSAYSGIGTGCVTYGSPPTVNLIGATGTGVTLTATTTTSTCGTITQTSSTNGATSTASCTNIYFVPFSTNATQTPSSGALATWLINSLADGPTQGQPRVP